MRIRIPALILSLVAVGFATQARAQCVSDQISPNPNPVGNEIAIATGVIGCNALNPFDNRGVIRILGSGILNNDGTLNSPLLPLMTHADRGRLPGREKPA